MRVILYVEDKLSLIDLYFPGSCSADVASASDGAAELSIGNVGGVFVVLICGCSAACLLGIIEFLWNIKAIAIEERVLIILRVVKILSTKYFHFDPKITPWEALRSELLFALDIRLSTKPVHPSQSSSDGSSSKSSLESSATRSMTSRTNKAKEASVYSMHSNINKI